MSHHGPGPFEHCAPVSLIDFVLCTSGDKEVVITKANGDQYPRCCGSAEHYRTVCRAAHRCLGPDATSRT